MITLFNAVTDRLTATIYLFLAACLLAVLSVFSPALYMTIIKEIAKEV